MCVLLCTCVYSVCPCNVRPEIDVGYLAVFLNCFPPHIFETEFLCLGACSFGKISSSLGPWSLCVSLSLHCFPRDTRVQSGLDLMWVLRSELRSPCLYSKHFAHRALRSPDCFLKAGVMSLYFCHENLNSRRQEISLGCLN